MKFLSILSLSLILVACASSSSKKDPPVSDPVVADQPDNTSGDVPADDSGTPITSSDSSSPAPVDAGPHVPTNQAECVSACEAKYPKSAALGKQLDSACFVGGTCEPVCDNLVYNGKNFGVTPDPDASAPISCPIGEGVDPISTPSAACSDCIARTPTCCSLWVAIFGSAEGRSLNACSNTCFTSFKN